MRYLERRCAHCRQLLFKAAPHLIGQVEIKCYRVGCRRINIYGDNPNGRSLLECRCANCGRLMFKVAPGTFGKVEAKCYRANCRELNTFEIDTMSTMDVVD